MAKQQPAPQKRPGQPQQPNNPNQAINPMPAQVRKPAPAPARRTESKASLFNVGSNELIYGRQNFIWMGLGLVLVVAGLLAMTGGAMPSPDVWDESIIYSFRRITLAPLLMVAGFVITLIGIFKKNDQNNEAITQNNETAA